MNKLLLLTFSIIVFSSLQSFGQGFPPGGPGFAAPIDGGAIALVIAGAAYGYKRVNRKKQKDS